MVLEEHLLAHGLRRRYRRDTRLFQYAQSARGYKAIGGEIFVPFLVPLFWYLVELVKGAFMEFSKEPEEET